MTEFEERVFVAALTGAASAGNRKHAVACARFIAQKAEALRDQEARALPKPAPTRVPGPGVEITP